MAEKRMLTKRQMAVLDDLLTGELDDEKVFEKHRLSSTIFRKWLNDDNFNDELNFRMKAAHLKSRLIIARYSQVAALKLVELVGSDKEETARKACLDIMSVPTQANQLSGPNQNNPDQQSEQLSPALASKLLMMLAQTDENSE